jgi:hypothetical protein
MWNEERVNLIWIPTEANLADVATKELPATAPTFLLFKSVAETIVDL